ncbi:hypothetical protein PG996_008040 [Apiospora saccharicola]|uniref:Uncharacterized protein n=1 Tax=Apiospora saccharicola TaxID=335842 RepID=A0ABR1UWU0_9PEZI
MADAGRIGNLPAAEGMREVTASMDRFREQFRQLQQEINELFQSINGRLDSIDTKLDRIDTRLAASDANRIAALENNSVVSETEPLVRLRSVLSNQEIARFPANVAAINAMTIAKETNALLRELGHSIDGNLSEKKRRLKLAIGVGNVMRKV